MVAAWIRAEIGVGQEAGDVALVAIFLERADRQRAEQFFGHREAGEQALEVARVAKRQVDATRQRALGRAGRADQQRVLTRERAEQAQAQDLAALDQAGFEHFKQAGQAGAIHRTPRDQARGPCVAP